VKEFDNDKKKIIVSILMLVAHLTSSCDISWNANAPSRVDQTQVLLRQYTLQKTDLPGAGWRVQGDGWGTDYGGENYGITFVRDQHVFINHTLSIHPSDEQAQQAFKEWEDKWIKLMNLQSAVPYVSINQKDDYVSGCYQSQPTDPLMVCIYLQRHNRIISFVQVNLDSGSANNLTFEEINDILGIVDKRVNEMVVDTTAETPSQ
jgi:hypothetical protein